jgi:phospholipid/cholesterol/gamma-HCH transport system substrate-binding protein
MKQGIIETIVGFIILVVAAGFFIFAYKVSNVGKTRDGYDVTASFQDIEGIAKGADVKLAGIKIGYVDDLRLDPETYYVSVSLYIDKGVEIPEDSRAIVATSGLFGGKYIRITPGGSEDNLTNQGKIKFTQSSLNFEDLISKLMYSITSK